ncbi:MAG: TerB family tellurite resistance protein, partial [Ignavibacteriaceae bacterium]
MFDYLRKTLLQDKKQDVLPKPVEKREEDHHKKLQIATAALFVEMAKADGNFSEEERERVIHTMRNTFHLDEACV